MTINPTDIKKTEITNDTQKEKALQIRIDRLRTIVEAVQNKDRSADYETTDLRELVHQDMLNDMLYELTERQLTINKEKSEKSVKLKTNEQVSNWVNRLFPIDQPAEMNTITAKLLYYKQYKGNEASFLGFQKFLDRSAHRTMEDLTEDYFSLVWKEEKEQLYDLIAADDPFDYSTPLSGLSNA